MSNPVFKPKKIPLMVRVRGFFAEPIPYVVNVVGGNWNQYLTKNYEPQKWGFWDSDCCWALSSVNNVETQLNMLKATNQFSQDALNFFQTNGYLDVNGQFALSELFIEKLCGVRDAGGTAPEAAEYFIEFSMIPRSMLCYSTQRAQQFTDQEEFDADYFNPNEVTQAMRDLGQQFKKYVKINPAQKISPYFTTPPQNVLSYAMQQAPVNYGIPVPSPIELWNQTTIPYTGDTTLAHEVLGIEPFNNGYPFLDQYNPYLKTLSPDYYIGYANQIIVEPIATTTNNPVVQNKNQDDLWTIIFGWINGLVDLLGNKIGRL